MLSSDNLSPLAPIKNLSPELILEIFSRSGFAAFVKNLEGRYLFINEVGARMLNRKVDQVIGKTDRELFSKSSADLMRSRDLMIMKGGKTVHYEAINTARGITRVFRSTKSPIFDHFQKVVGLLGFSEDITPKEKNSHRRKIEEESKNLRLRLMTNDFKLCLTELTTTVNSPVSTLLAKLETLMGVLSQAEKLSPEIKLAMPKLLLESCIEDGKKLVAETNKKTSFYRDRLPKSKRTKKTRPVLRCV